MSMAKDKEIVEQIDIENFEEYIFTVFFESSFNELICFEIFIAQIQKDLVSHEVVVATCVEYSLYLIKFELWVITCV
ncbi:MAG: hypothetical protein GY750_19450 [Lentisphaerae bacterium]|nr:hypothetical protein [Lentisphaerota bacterium]MCP4103573.1 hypothetical protein [Lentisphaerota bacterium]